MAKARVKAPTTKAPATKAPATKAVVAREKKNARVKAVVAREKGKLNMPAMPVNKGKPKAMAMARVKVTKVATSLSPILYKATKNVAKVMAVAKTCHLPTLFHHRPKLVVAIACSMGYPFFFVFFKCARFGLISDDSIIS